MGPLVLDGEHSGSMSHATTLPGVKSQRHLELRALEDVLLPSSAGLLRGPGLRKTVGTDGADST